MSEDKFDVEVKGKRAPKPGPIRKKRQGGAGVAVLGTLWRIVRGFWRLRGPRTGLFAVLALGYVLAAHGTPHILFDYQCTGVGTPGKRCYDCRYIGVEGIRPHRAGNWDCPVFVMLPLNWGAIYRGLFDG